MKKNKGFTLVELMVVIVIIGILAALAIPRFLGATNKTKASEFKPVLKQMYTLQTAYKQERDSYTTDKTLIGFEEPAASARFSYSALAPTNANATTGGAGNSIGVASLKTEGSIKTVANADLAAGTKACIDAGTVQYAANGLYQLASVESGTCP